MSAEPESEPSKFKQIMKSCWSCRVLYGGGMIAAGVYVYLQARKLALRTGPTTGTVVHFTIGFSMVAWGVVIIHDPVGKAIRKT